MKITTEGFITSFHTLTGTTIGERQKNFYVLLNTVRRYDHAQIDFSQLQPKTPLEEKFKVDALIYFRKVPELLEVLKCENPILIERTLKASSWFLEEALQNVSGEQLANSIFPYISFNAKVKILNKLAINLKDVSKADEYFKCVEEKYGFYLASKLIPCCSLDLIKRCIKVNRLRMLAKHLLVIIKKQPDLAESLLKELKDTEKIDDLQSEYKNVFRYLARNDVVLFLKLNKEYPPVPVSYRSNTSFRLGWRVTNKYVLENKEAVIKSPQYYYEILHNKQIAKSLNKSFPKLYFNMFPATLNQFGNCTDKIIDMCRTLPKKICNVDLLLKTFKEVYGSNIWEHSDYINTTFLDMLSLEHREAVVKIDKRPNQISEEKWYTYMKTETSIPYLKKTILLSSVIKSRADLISLLVETCKINDDKKALVKLCNYMVTKHRNDHMSVRLAFLKAIKRYFKLADLEEQHWTAINELIEIFTLNEEHFYHAPEFIEGYIYYLLKHDKNIKEEVKNYMKAEGNNYNIIKEKPEYEKKCLVMFGKLLPEMYKDDELKNHTFTFLNAIVDWNKRHPNDQISLSNYPDAMNMFKLCLKEEGATYQLDNLLNFCVFKLSTESEERKEILKCYFTEKNNTLNEKVINFLLKKEPLTIRENIETVTKCLLQLYWSKSNGKFWNACRYFTHLEIPQEVIKICTNSPDTSAEEYQNEYIISNSILAISCLMSTQEFNDFIKDYYPPELTVDSKSKSKEEKRKYTIQQHIGKSLKYRKPTSSALESLLVFCKGDYLKLVRGSLYSICDNVNEDKLPVFFNELSNRAVSVRKHAMHLTLRVLDKQHVFSVLKRFMETEKNASVRKFIFKSIFNFFTQNPSDYSWDMFKTNMKAVDMNDKEAVEILLQIDKIPREYFIRYLLFTWDILQNTPDPQNYREGRFGVLLNSISPETIQLLPKEFCQKVIDNYFLKNTTGLTHYQSVVNTFVCKYIIYCNSEEEQDLRLNSSFEIVKNCGSTKNEDIEKWADLWNYISDILKEFCMQYLSKNKCNNVRILKKFADLWKNSFPPHKAISEYLHLEFTLIYVERLPLMETGKKLAELCNELANTFGNIIVPVFSKKIIFFYDYFLSNKNNEDNQQTIEKLSLIGSLLQPNPSIACLILVLTLLDNDSFNTEETKEQYKKIIAVLEKQTDPAVQVYYYNHLRCTTTLDHH